MTEQEAIVILEKRRDKLINYNEQCETQEEYEEFLEAIECALIALRRGDTLAISHGWTKEAIDEASLSVTTATFCPGNKYKIYDMKTKTWSEE